MLSSLGWSAELVGEPACAALAAVSVVDGRFPLEVAAAVSGDRAALETLVDRSLVQFDVVEGRYVLLEIVRGYASALLARTGAADVVHARPLDWAVTFAREVRDGLEHAEPDTVRRVDLADAARSCVVDDAVGYDDRVLAVVHETATRQGHVFDNRAIYLCEIVDGRWASLRTMDMDHDTINRFWDAVGMPAATTVNAVSGPATV